MTGDAAADWFDYWIDTYANPATKIFAHTWSRKESGPLGIHPQRAVIGIDENGTDAHLYDIERSSHT